AADAMSRGFPTRRSSFVVSGPRSCAYETTRPTMMVLQRMPCFPNSTATVLVREFTPPFAALYADRPGTPNTAPPEEMLTIDPPPASSMCGIAYFDVQNMLVRVPRTMSSHSWVDSSVTGLKLTLTSAVGAALLMRVVIGPYASTVAATASWTLASSATSRGTNMASPPASRIRWTFFSPLSTERPLRTTLAPSSANTSAMVRPMPRVEPVTSATLPSSLMRRILAEVRRGRQPVPGTRCPGPGPARPGNLARPEGGSDGTAGCARARGRRVVGDRTRRRTADGRRRCARRPRRPQGRQAGRGRGRGGEWCEHRGVRRAATRAVRAGGPRRGPAAGRSRRRRLRHRGRPAGAPDRHRRRAVAAGVRDQRVRGVAGDPGRAGAAHRVRRAHDLHLRVVGGPTAAGHGCLRDQQGRARRAGAGVAGRAPGDRLLQRRGGQHARHRGVPVV